MYKFCGYRVLNILFKIMYRKLAKSISNVLFVCDKHIQDELHLKIQIASRWYGLIPDLIRAQKIPHLLFIRGKNNIVYFF